MTRRIGAIIILFLFVLAFIPMAAHGENTPYTIYGQVTADGVGINGLHVTIYDTNTQESMSYLNYDTLTTWTGANGPGYYSANIGNMVANWSRGDTIYVNVTFTAQGATLSMHFTIPATGYIYEQDVAYTTGKTNGGTQAEGQNQWHGVPTLEDIINWIRHINLEDLVIVLAIVLAATGAIMVLSSAVSKRRRRR